MRIYNLEGVHYIYVFSYRLFVSLLYTHRQKRSLYLRKDVVSLKRFWVPAKNNEFF